MKSLASTGVKPGYFLPYQLAYLGDEARFKILEKSRRIGGTYMQSYEDVRDLIRNKDLPAVYFSSADLTAAAEYINYCAQWAKVFDVVGKEKDLVVLESEKDIKTYVIELNIGGKKKKIHALSSNPKNMRSKGGKLVLDEFGWHDDPEKMWAAARPVVTWGYPVRILSTHNGIQSLFNRFIQRTRKGKLSWSLHSIPIQRAVADGLVDKILKKTCTEEERQAWLAEEHASCADENAWLQEYCCQPTDENTAFLTYEMLFGCERDGILSDLSDVTGPLFLGMDIARRRDLSVIYVLELLGHVLYTRKVVRMEKTSFADQKKVLWPLLAHPKMRRACLDDSGLGMQLTEEAQREFGRFKVEAVTFTADVKEEIAYGLYTDFEDRQLYIPPDEVARESLHSVRKTVTAAGNIRFDAPRSETTGHADDFWALGLARHGARDGKAGEVFVASAPRESENARAFTDAFHPYSRRDLSGY